MRAVLIEHGFEPYDDHDGSMALRNCPFHQLAERHREIVCTMNLALLEGVASGIGAQDARPVLEPVVGRCCVVVRTARKPDVHQPCPTDGAP
jgi:predicted ArsR family transcriptional regulator